MYGGAQGVGAPGQASKCHIHLHKAAHGQSSALPHHSLAPVPPQGSSLLRFYPNRAACSGSTTRQQLAPVLPRTCSHTHACHSTLSFRCDYHMCCTVPIYGRRRSVPLVKAAQGVEGRFAFFYRVHASTQSACKHPACLIMVTMLYKRTASTSQCASRRNALHCSLHILVARVTSWPTIATLVSESHVELGTVLGSALLEHTGKVFLLTCPDHVIYRRLCAALYIPSWRQDFLRP